MPENQGQEKRRRGIPSPFTAVRMVRLGISAVRTVGAIGAFFANPASLAVLVPVGLFILAIFVIFFGSGFKGVPELVGTPGTPGGGEITVPQPIFPPGVASDCPVPGGRISTHSYQEGGHCAVGYGLEGRCQSDCPGGIGGSRRAKAIDIPTNGKDVILPTLQSQQVKWKLVKKGYPIATEDGGGLGHIFEANLGSDKWNLDMLHMQQTSLIEGEEYFSGTPVGKSYQPWVHTTIGKNVVNPTSPASYATDCDSGWQATDFICR